MLQVAGGADLGLYILQVGQGLIENLQLPLGRGGRLGWGSDHRHLLLLEDAEGLWRMAARRAGAGAAARVAGGRARCDGRGGGGGAAAEGSGICTFDGKRDDSEDGEEENPRSGVT